MWKKQYVKFLSQKTMIMMKKCTKKVMHRRHVTLYASSTLTPVIDLIIIIQKGVGSVMCNNRTTVLWTSNYNALVYGTIFEFASTTPDDAHARISRTSPRKQRWRPAAETMNDRLHLCGVIFGFRISCAIIARLQLRYWGTWVIGRIITELSAVN
jgi:hypothetical protein